MDIATRIIVEHGGWDDINRTMLDMLYSTYSLDPLFLITHFYRDHRIRPKGGSKPMLRFTHPSRFLSFASLFSLDYREQFSGLPLEDISPQTGDPFFTKSGNCDSGYSGGDQVVVR